MFKYLLHILIAVDQLGTAIVGGYPDETLSSYAHRLYVQKKFFGFFRNVINTLFFWQTDHCLSAYNDETTRRQFPPVLR